MLQSAQPVTRPNSLFHRRHRMHRGVLTLLRLALALGLSHLALSEAAFAQGHAGHAVPAEAKTAVLVTGYGNWHHPVSTKNAQAQAFFDQGLRQIYAFNHDEATRSFERASELDPKLAMAFWGLAEAVGPNYNDPASEDRFLRAHAAMEKAQALAGDASDSDQAYIAALAKRFPGDAKSDLRAAAEQYRDAMREVMKRFPDDLDAATLFAEAGMNLHPWGLWDGRNAGRGHGRNCGDAGVRDSARAQSPGRDSLLHSLGRGFQLARARARRRESSGRAGARRGTHRAHARAHLHPHGRLRSGVEDQPESRACGSGVHQGRRGPGHLLDDVLQPQPALHRHGSGDERQLCRVTARRAVAGGKRGAARERHAGLGGFMTVPMAVEVRFHRWNEILKMPQPDPAIATVTVFWHFARGLALAGTGDVDGAAAEHKMVAEAEEKTSPEAIFQMPINNKTKDILKIAENVLGAKISLAKNDMDATVNQLRAAVAVEDGLKYDEPKDWFYPVRESLGAALLKIGDYAGAEEVFRADLERNPSNPRSLFGLEEALKAQDKA